jgi:hypothetical protein
MGRLRLVLVGLAMASVGCSQDGDVGGGVVLFDLPPARFSVVSGPNDPRWRSSPPEGIPDLVCSGPAALSDDCCHPPGRENGVDCQRYPLSCDAAGWCALGFDYNHQVVIDLGGRVPALSERRGWVLASADLPGIECTVDLQGLPIESAALYVAPQGVLSPESSASRFLVDLPLDTGGVAAGVALDGNARFALSPFLADFNTPFTLILDAHIAIEATHIRGGKTTWAPGETATFDIKGRVRASF